MNLLQYSLAALVTYFGLFVGFFLALIAKEEIKPGKKYFVFLKEFLLLLIFIFLIVFIKLNYLLVLLILVFIIIIALKKHHKKLLNESEKGLENSKNFQKDFNELPLVYIVLGIIFYASSKTTNVFIIESSLIFLYSLPTGSLLTKKSKTKTIIEILKNIGFLVIAIILFLVL